MKTKHPNLFHELSNEFDSREIKTRSLGGRQICYVTARTVMNRLDKVLGPENWWDDYTPLEHGVLCKLTIRLEDGTTITKADAGGNAGMSDEGDDEKSGYSDAFKRAAVKFGVGRHLYGDGIPMFIPEYDGPKTKGEFASWLKSVSITTESKEFAQLMEWARNSSMPTRVNDWSADQIKAAYTWLATEMARS